ncbi:hypothetical protein ACUM5Y_01030 [Marinomonas dokdonensis]|uniref:hypothetical protein n=1 Tax=Marinomonas dokdonensis TaxID=328224 RepID=UPI0040556432
MALPPINSAATNLYSSQLATKQYQQTSASEDKEEMVVQVAEESVEQAKEVPEENSIKSFTHGFFGLDKPGEVVEEEKKDDAYTAGKVMKTLGTIGSIIAIIV